MWLASVDYVGNNAALNANTPIRKVQSSPLKRVDAMLLLSLINAICVGFGISVTQSPLAGSRNVNEPGDHK